MSPDLVALGSFIRQRRQALGLTQTQLGERLGWVQERISLLERAKYGTPSLPALAQIAHSVEVSLGEILLAAGYSDVTVPKMSDSEVEQRDAGALLYALHRFMAIEATELRVLFTQACDVLIELMGADKVDVFLYDEPTATLEALGTSHTEMGEQQHRRGLHRLPIANRGRLVEVFETGISYCTGHAEDDVQELIGIREELGVRSTIYARMPITVDRYGVLGVCTKNPDRYSRDDVLFLESVARWLGLMTHRVELTDMVTKAAVDSARQLTAEELIRVLAHDLGNHVTPIRGRIAMIQRRAKREGRDDYLRDAEEAEKSMGRLQQMISELLDVSRLDQSIFALTKQPTDLVAVARQVIDEVQTTEATIELRAPESLVILADASRLCQAMENLIGNAIKHSPPDVAVMVEIQTEQRDDGPWVTITIQDEGPGIPAELMPTLFSRFTTGPESSGLGMGLYLARGIAEAHHGTLTVESLPTMGSTFHLSFPIQDAC